MKNSIQVNVPICPKCAEALKHNHITHDFFCYNCRSFYRIVGEGKTDRELLCEEQKK